VMGARAPECTLVMRRGYPRPRSRARRPSHHGTGPVVGPVADSGSFPPGPTLDVVGCGATLGTSDLPTGLVADMIGRRAGSPGERVGHERPLDGPGPANGIERRTRRAVPPTGPSRAAR
jgi:hypothetical protein